MCAMRHCTPRSRQQHEAGKLHLANVTCRSIHKVQVETAQSECITADDKAALAQTHSSHSTLLQTLSDFGVTCAPCIIVEDATAGLRADIMAHPPLCATDLYDLPPLLDHDSD